MGDIANEQVDAIVNSTDERLALDGAVSKALLKRGGPEIVREFDRIRSRHGTKSAVRQMLKAGLVTSGGQLNASNIIHVLAPSNSAVRVYSYCRLGKIFNFNIKNYVGTWKMLVFRISLSIVS